MSAVKEFGRWLALLEIKIDAKNDGRYAWNMNYDKQGPALEVRDWKIVITDTGYQIPTVFYRPNTVILKYRGIRLPDKDLLSLCHTVTRNYCKVKYHTVIH